MDGELISAISPTSATNPCCFCKQGDSMLKLMVCAGTACGFKHSLKLLTIDELRPSLKRTNYFTLSISKQHNTPSMENP